MNFEEPEVVPWAETPYVFVASPPPPQCPRCGAEVYERSRTDSGGDGSRCRKVTCVACSLRYRLVLEPPAPRSGKHDPEDR